MSYPSKIENIEDELEQNVAKLFHNLGFDFVDSKYTLNSSHEEIGEIDLLFTYDKYLFLIEVTSDNYNRSEKKITFFSKWGINENIQAVRDEYNFPTKKIFRLFFDFSKNSFKEESESVNTFLRDQSYALIAYKEDHDYFANSVKKIGQWARNDFLDWADIKDSTRTKEIKAIQYYIQDIPVYCFIEGVNVLLHSCYISRRRRNSPDLGYQRTLEKKRITEIQRNIEKAEGLSFPNSILLHTPKLADRIYNKDECPREVDIRFPTSFCSCKVIDGQHRLLGFSKIDPSKLDQYFLTVVALPEIDPEIEFKTFIDINSQHKKMDNNLILHLKSDFSWPENSKERLEQIGVKVAEKLNDKTLKNRIFFGTADETRGDKITLVTLVNAFKNNQQILSNEEETFKKVQKIFSLIGEFMPEQIKSDGFFSQNRGIRILFRLIHLFERNQKAGKVSVSQKDFFSDLKLVLDENTIEQLSEFYGGGGATAAAKQIVMMLKDTISSKYDNMQDNLKGI